MLKRNCLVSRQHSTLKRSKLQNASNYGTARVCLAGSQLGSMLKRNCLVSRQHSTYFINGYFGKNLSGYYINESTAGADASVWLYDRSFILI